MAVKQPNAVEKLLFGKKVKNWSDLAHFLTNYKYVLLSEKAPEKWPAQWHEGTSYKYYVQPEAEIVAVPKVRWRAMETVKFRWYPPFVGISTKPSDPSGASAAGHGSGLPMQMGTDQMRSVTYGWAAYGEQNKIRVPKPAKGDYWIGGAPKPTYDRNCCIVSPSGEVFELIQFDPDQPENIFMNQALGAGRFRDTELVEGTTTGAAQVCNSAYTWDRRSKSNHHTMGIILFDYNGHDGLLPSIAPGYDIPKVGDLFALDGESKSAQDMLRKGGECAEMALSMMEYGVRVLDRSGYSDVKDNAKDIGKEPHPCVIKIQAGTWPGSNIAEFTIALEDLVYVTSHQVVA